MKEKIMAMKVGDVLGCKVRHKSEYQKIRTSVVKEIRADRLTVTNYFGYGEMVEYGDVLDVVDAKNQS